MHRRLSRVQRLFLAALLAAFLAVGFWPTIGPPQFRYTRSDSDRKVWNLGWPMATCIVDTEAAKTFNVGPWAYVWGFATLVLLAACLAVFFAWNNRERMAARRARAWATFTRERHERRI